MTREQCELKIATYMKCIKDTYKEYRGNSDFLSLVIVNGDIDFHNRYYDEDSDFPINCGCREGDNKDD